MKKLVFESLNEFINHPPAGGSFADHLIRSLQMESESDVEDLINLVDGNRDMLDVVDNMKNAAVDWSWDDIDDHNVVVDDWIDQAPIDREGVRAMVEANLDGLSEFLDDADMGIDPSPYFKELASL